MSNNNMTNDDYVESPFVNLGDSGNDKGYTHSAAREKDWIPPERDWDDLDVKLKLINCLPPEPTNTISSQALPVTRANTMELRWAWHHTSNAEQQGQERNRLRYGRLITDGQNYTLWGMATWYEAKRHIHVSDRKLIQQCWEEIVYEVSQRSQYAGDHKSCIWCVKSEKQTRAGAWAISIETAQQRDILIYANQTLISKTLDIKSMDRINLSSKKSA